MTQRGSKNTSSKKTEKTKGSKAKPRPAVEEKKSIADEYDVIGGLLIPKGW